MELTPLNKTQPINEGGAEPIEVGSASIPVQNDATPPQPQAAPQTAQPQTVKPATVVVQQQPAQPVQVPKIDFVPKTHESDVPVTVDKATEKANEIVGEVFGQAVMHTVVTDDVREQLLSTAKKVVQDKAETIADAAEKENKAQHFKKHEDACNYFGYDEQTTSKFHVKAMAFWAFVLNTIYIFTIGYFVVAPVSFILKKLVVVVKKTWVAVLLALLIYLFIVVGIPAISVLIAKMSGAG